MDRSEKIVIIAIAAVVAGCLCISLPFFLLAKSGIFAVPPTATMRPTATALATPTIEPPTATPETSKTLGAEKTLEILRNALLPPANPLSQAYRFKGVSKMPSLVETAPPEYRIGDGQSFWIWEVDDESNRQVDATLRYVTGDVYFWIENEVPYDEASLENVVETFSNEILPKAHAFFGSEPIPGVDNDPHIYVLYARGLGESIAGYMSPGDWILPEVYEYSNAHEMFEINADIQSLRDPYTLSVMAHELQHLIHQSQDPNEDLWLNEGFSELATLINGFKTGGFDSIFLQNPDLQLNDWSSDDENSTPHYGASFLFVTYMMGRFGEEFTRSVVASEQNGLQSIDSTLNDLGITDSQTGMPVTAERLFADWAVANFLQDKTIGDGRYSYPAYPDAPSAGPTERQTKCTDLVEGRDVSQFGTDYIQLVCGAPSIFTFQGSTEVKIIPDDPPDRSPFMWSNVANSSDMTLTREFDFRDVKTPIEFTFDAWYDLEDLYDFGYVLASEDGGASWNTLVSTSCTHENTTGNNYGCAFNGSSAGWLTETVNLTYYAGKQVLLRFESITDGAVLGEGFAVDNISIPELDYYENFNASDGGWQTDGFVRIQNLLPQTYVVSVIDENIEATVTTYTVNGREKLEIPIRAGNDLFPVTIVVSGSTAFTRQKAQYEYSVAYTK